MMLGVLDAAGETSSTSTSSSTDVMGKDDFLRLLITQLEYQDPLSPADSMAFSAQLAQFSSLEQLSNLNESFETLLLYQASLNNSQAMNFLGMTVKAHGNQIELPAEGAETIFFELAAEATEVQVLIYDENGVLVRKLEPGAMSAGEQELEWDGVDAYGIRSPEGRYRTEIVATAADGESVPATPLVQQAVTGVVFRNDGTYLEAGGQEIAVASVIEILEQ